TRIELASGVEAASGGIGGRFFRELWAPLSHLAEVPFFGAGLGVGTNVGATLLTGQAQFLISEGEWGRILLEMGPLFGLLFVGFRLALALRLGKASLAAAQAGQLL